MAPASVSSAKRWDIQLSYPDERCPRTTSSNTFFLVAAGVGAVA